MKRILVIEDEAGLRATLSRMLDLEGFEVLTAENGARGVALAKQHLPDLVFCDLKMPELDGYGVLCAIRAEPSTAAIPLVFVTASADKPERQQGLASGAAAYLTKPFSRGEILEAIRGALK
ncbi:MAG: response regulator [Burkholderiales bacterium]